MTTPLVGVIAIILALLTGSLPAHATGSGSNLTIGDLSRSCPSCREAFTVTISGINPTDHYFAAVTTTEGTVVVPVTTGLTPAYGYTLSGPATELSFTGTGADISQALASVLFNRPTNGRSAIVSVIVSEPAGPNTYFNPGNHHYYQYVAGNPTWVNARADALTKTLLGDTGHLLNINDAQENAFVRDHINASNIWLGATRKSTSISPATDSSSANQGLTWNWADGPEAGTSFARTSTATGGSVTSLNGMFAAFAVGQPNNGGDSAAWSENYLATNFRGTLGLWNDVTLNGSGQTMSEIVEYPAGLSFSGQQFEGTNTFTFGDGAGAGTGANQSLANTGWSWGLPAGVGVLTLIAGAALTFAGIRSRRRNG